jgi:hypothetical protein
MPPNDKFSDCMLVGATMSTRSEFSKRNLLGRSACLFLFDKGHECLVWFLKQSAFRRSREKNMFLNR